MLVELPLLAGENVGKDCPTSTSDKYYSCMGGLLHAMVKITFKL